MIYQREANDDTRAEAETGFYKGANLDGYVLYDTNKILRPDGGIQVTSGQSFICNNQIYDISDNILNILNPGSGNDLIPQEICAMPLSSGAHELIVYNKVRKSLLIAESNSNTGYGVTYEFDGNSLKETGLDYSVAIQFVNTMQYNPDNVFKTSEAWYLKNGNSFIKIDFANWEVSNFTLNGIEIYEISANEDAPEFCFSGLNYSDASQVFGIVKSDDSVVISGKVPNTTKIVNMIPLN